MARRSRSFDKASAVISRCQLDRALHLRVAAPPRAIGNVAAKEQCCQERLQSSRDGGFARCGCNSGAGFSSRMGPVSHDLPRREIARVRVDVADLRRADHFPFPRNALRPRAARRHSAPAPICRLDGRDSGRGIVRGEAFGRCRRPQVCNYFCAARCQSCPYNTEDFPLIYTMLTCG